MTQPYACRFCRHDIEAHGNVHGCEHCRCLGTRGEATPQTDGEVLQPVLTAGLYAPGYEPVVTEPAKPAQEHAECYVVQFRVKSHSSTTWGQWTTTKDYLRPETAMAECDRWRRAHEKNPTVPSVRSPGEVRPAPDEEWRVLKVTQEVVY